jgi:hypothetical protein
VKIILIRKQIGDWVFALTATRIETTVGLNSILKDGHHILMWETDLPFYDSVYNNLKKIQIAHDLPCIHIFRSSKAGGYHAICLKRSSWREAVALATELIEVDMKWIQACVSRGYFTMRIGLKHEREPVAFNTVLSNRLEDVDISELINYDRYEIHANSKMR